MLPERDIEKWLVKQVRRLGGEAYKFVSPGNDGVPDRIVLLPGGEIWFVELKREDGVTSSIQEYQLHKIRQTGAKAVVLHGRFEVFNWIRLREQELKEKR